MKLKNRLHNKLGLPRPVDPMQLVRGPMREPRVSGTQYSKFEIRKETSVDCRRLGSDRLRTRIHLSAKQRKKSYCTLQVNKLPFLVVIPRN